MPIVKKREEKKEVGNDFRTNNMLLLFIEANLSFEFVIGYKKTLTKVKTKMSID